MRKFRDIKAWQKAHQLALEIYAATSNFPADERYGLTTQLKRAAASIPTNIAEGCGRRSEREFANFLNIAFGSASELEYFLLLCRDLSLLNENRHSNLHSRTEEVKRMLSAFMNRLKAEH